MDEPAQEQRDNSGQPPRGRPFPPGVSGNPAGRPKGRSLLAYLRDQADLDDGGKPKLEKVAEAAFREAMAGDVRAIAFVAERLDGKVPDRQHHSGGVTIRVEYADDAVNGHDDDGNPDAPAPPPGPGDDLP